MFKYFYRWLIVLLVEFFSFSFFLIIWNLPWCKIYWKIPISSFFPNHIISNWRLQKSKSIKYAKPYKRTKSCKIGSLYLSVTVIFSHSLILIIFFACKYKNKSLFHFAWNESTYIQWNIYLNVLFLFLLSTSHML